MTDKDEGFDLELAKVRDEALKACFGIVPGEPFLATLKLGDKEFSVVGEITPEAASVAGWIIPTGDYDSLIYELLPTVNPVVSTSTELVFGGGAVEVTLPILFLQFSLPIGAASQRPHRPPILVRAVFSDWPGNGGRWFDYATVGIQGLPLLLSHSRTYRGTWVYADGTEHPAGGSLWGGVTLNVDGWQLELRGTRGGGGDPAYSYTGAIRRDDREPFPISRLEIFLSRVELFLSVYANRRRRFAVVGASRSIRPNAGHYPAWVSYRCRIRTGSAEYQPIPGLDVVPAGNEDSWLALFPDFYRHCADPVFEDAVRHYVEAGEHLLLNPRSSFVDAWGTVERLYQKFSGNGSCEPGRLLRIIKKNRQALAELGNPYQYVTSTNSQELAFLKSFYRTRNDFAHGRSTRSASTLARAQQWWGGTLNGGEESALTREQPTYYWQLIRFMRLARALIIVHLKQGNCPGNGSGNVG